MVTKERRPEGDLTEDFVSISVRMLVFLQIFANACLARPMTFHSLSETFYLVSTEA